MRLKAAILPGLILMALGAIVFSFVGCGGDGDGGDFCSAYCPAVLAASCQNGPSDMEDCQGGCNHAKTTCPTEFAALQGCTGASPTFSCDANQSPTADGCETENAALYTCLYSQ
jgi:hypothetical protein